MKVLLTGAGGSVGTVLCPGLSALGHEVVGVDRVAAPAGLPEASYAAWHRGDLDDPALAEELVATHAPDAVVHLAGIPTEASLPDSLSSHVLLTGRLLEAMVAHRVPRIVYASSNHAVGRTRRGGLPGDRLGTDVRPRPDTFYGVGKVAAEALLSLYADRHGLEVVSCRIGSFLPRPGSRRALATWLSPGDAVRMTHAALTAPLAADDPFAVLYGISANTRGWWDLAPGLALGYQPVDDAEDHAADVEAEAPTDEDAAEAAYVGGPYATPVFERPAF